jgi:4-hydroxy 2-oxovalerate aldolase
VNCLKLFDCTLRDGANVLGKGFPADLTKLMLEGLIENGITTIEYGNAGGIGAYDVSNSIAPLTDVEYLELVQPYLGRAEIGMFLNAKRYREQNVLLAAEKGLAFLRVGADAGDSNIAMDAIRLVANNGMKVCYSLMKAYIVSPHDLAEESKKLEAEGVNEITIMDSAGFMTPDQTAGYTEALVKAVKIPVGFHGHNNLGLSVANVLAALENGAEIIDCGLLGMARSVGNTPTEVITAVLQREDKMKEVNLFGLLRFLDDRLIPAMKKHDYHVAITPLDLILGYSGCHSGFIKLFRDIAAEKKVDLYQLIVEVTRMNQKSPTEEQIRAVAETL